MRAEAQQRAERTWRLAQERGITIVGCDDPRYPESLSAIEDPPPVLFCLGDVGLLQQPAVGIVGSRAATSYGLRVTASIVPTLASHGLVIISGLALGIDAAAHSETLDCAGRTIAVLGTGVDVPYPLENEWIYKRIEASGLLISELLPGTRAHPGSFPTRNRLIAALSDVVVVIEAGAKSGALITAQAAANAGRIVGAVPGPVDHPASAGTNSLLRDGAQVVTGVQDVMGLVALTPRGRTLATSQRELSEPPTDNYLIGDREARVLEVLANGPRMADELVGSTGLSARDTAATLASLSVLGRVVVDSAGLARLQ